MLRLSEQVIYNKIEQCLVGIPSDFHHQEACEVNNAVKFNVVNGMQNLRANENRSLKLGNQ